jgi:hypothetical protein
MEREARRWYVAMSARSSPLLMATIATKAQLRAFTADTSSVTLDMLVAAWQEVERSAGPRVGGR